MNKHTRRIAGVAFLSLLLAACVSRGPASTWTAHDVKARKVIVFVPGLYGSALAEVTTGERIFQTLGQALWGRVPLALAGAELGIPGTLRLRSDGILERVTVVPLLYSVDAYGGSVAYLQDVFGERARIIAFSYDWRQDDVKAAQALGRLVRELRAAGATSIALVGHSLGAVLTAFYLRYGEQELDTAVESWEGTRHVDAAVLAALPFRGSAKAFYDMLHGTAVGLSKVPLAATSLGSFPSFYQFLPPAESTVYLDRELVPIGREIFRAANWRPWRAGLFADTVAVDAETLARRESYTERCLALGSKFSARMRAPAGAKAPRRTPLLSVVATGVPTLAKAVWTGSQWAFDAKALREALPGHEPSLVEDGDGIVTTASARLPEALAMSLDTESATVAMEHRGMFTRRELQELVTPFLTRHGF